jgi:uncharacterized protein (DUF58 family)
VILLGILIVFVVLTVLQRAVYSRFWRRNLSVELDFSARTGIEGSSISLTEIITSRKALPLPWLVVKFQVSRHLFFPDNQNAAITDDYYREDLFSLGLYQRLSRTLPVDLQKRGYFTIKSIDLVSSDLLLTQKLVGHAQSRSVLTVTPRLIAREDLEIPFRQLIGSVLVRSALLPDPFEFRSIREYQSHDTMKSVNWLATARTSQLKVNVNDYSASREVLILLNVEAEIIYFEEQLIEEGIRIAASICTYLTADGISCGLVSNARDILTGEPAEIPAGQSIQHVQHIQEQLGRLDLALQPADFAALLENRHANWSREPVLLMISFNCGSRICQAWTRCLAEGYQGLWILPRYAHQTGRPPAVTAPVFYWEVNRHVD